MPTTVHIPKSLLARVDERAKKLGISRNRLLVQVLEEKLTAPRKWPDALVRLLEAPVPPELREEVDRMLDEVQRARRNRRTPPKL